MITKSFKDFIKVKDGIFNEAEDGAKDWKKEFIQLENGFVPPPKMRPIIQAFVDSGDIKIMDDTSKGGVQMPKKNLFLTGGAVRDFLKGKSPNDYHLATNATPAQTALILAKAGFKLKGKANNLKLVFVPKPADEISKRIWFVSKSHSIGAIINNEIFEIETLRTDPKTGVDGKNFVDSPVEDAATRDITINAMYIELSKPDGENSKLYDPTKKGWHDANNGIVQPVGKAEDRFKEDPSRVLRTLRFHGRFSKMGDLNPDIKKAMDRHKDLSGVDLKRVRDEFLKGLLHPDTDIKRYIKIYAETGIMEKVFPGVKINSEIPSKFKRDKPLALAWLLQDNSIEKVAEVLSSATKDGKETGWTDQEKMAVLYLIALKEFTPQDRSQALQKWKGTGLSKGQIKDWVELFTYTDSKGIERPRKPAWALHVKTFADHDKPLAGPDDVAHLPELLRSKALGDLENKKFVEKLPVKDKED